MQSPMASSNTGMLTNAAAYMPNACMGMMHRTIIAAPMENACVLRCNRQDREEMQRESNMVKESLPSVERV